jgi:hypothetical protein
MRVKLPASAVRDPASQTRALRAEAPAVQIAIGE